MLSIGLAQASTGTIFDVGPFNLGLELDKPQQAIFEMELDSLSPGPASHPQARSPYTPMRKQYYLFDLSHDVYSMTLIKVQVVLHCIHL